MAGWWPAEATMLKVVKLAARNLARYWRRTVLTSGLIILGIVAVLLFVSVSGSFKNLIVGQITDSMLGHLQVHRRGYVASIDNLPLNLNMKPEAVAKVEQALGGMTDVVASSPGGRDGYLHIEDARELLRMAEPEVSEIAVRLKGLGQLDSAKMQLAQALSGLRNPQGQPALEVHG